MSAVTARSNRRGGRVLTGTLPWLMLAPSLLITFAVLIYPIWNGLRASLMNYRYGKAVSYVGLDNYTRLLSDPQFLNSLWVTLKFVTLAVSLETLLEWADRDERDGSPDPGHPEHS